MSAAELGEVRLADLGASTCGVRTGGVWTVYVPGCGAGTGQTYLAAFADALRRRTAN